MQKSRFTLNFLFLSSGEVLTKLLNFLAFAYLARLLGAENFGGIEIALAMVMAFLQVAEFGTNQYGAVEVARDQSLIPYLFARLFLVRSVLSVLAFLMLVGATFFLDRPWSVKYLVILFGVSLFGTPCLLMWLFQGLDRMHWIALNSIIKGGIFAAGIFILGQVQ